MAILSDCSTCMHTTTQTRRQEMGCGFEPPAPRPLVVRPWRHRAQTGPKATLCPGYTTRLPQVIETARMRFHWQNGAVPRLSEPMQRAIEILDGAANELDAFKIKEARERGRS